MYSSDLVSLDGPTSSQGNTLDFAVEFGQFYTNALRGTGRTVGIINEVGATQFTNVDGSGAPLGSQVRDLFEVTFTATASGLARFIGDPADIFPQQDTLLFQPTTVVNPNDIRYDVKELLISAAATGTAASEFQNQDNRFDVNNDGHVSPIDALSVINQLNQTGAMSLAGEAGSAGFSRRSFVDVNGDQFVTPMDALLVINALNRNAAATPSGELFASGNRTSNPTTSDADRASDEFFAAIGSEKASDFGSNSSSQRAGSIDWAASDSDDEEENDVIDGILLDVTEEWNG
ncbi:MAG: dockerin type I domain-containing protein [Pirellulaceae bacterium]